MKRLWLYGLMCLAMVSQAYAQGEMAPDDSVKIQPKRSFIQKIDNYINGGEKGVVKPYTNKPKVLVLGGPHYSTDEKLGIAAYGLLEFGLRGCDSTVQHSNFMAGIDVSTAGFWTVSTTGTMFFPHDSKRINLELRVGYAPKYFWGVGYDMGNNNANKTKLNQNEIKIQGDMFFRVVPSFYVGPSLEWNYYKCAKLDRLELLNGQRQSVYNYGFGFALQYDCRDNIRDASRGAYVYLRQMFYPKFLWNHYAYSMTDFHASVYHQAWKGAVVAAELRGLFNLGDPSWANMALLGNNSSMRGYYKGQFRDMHSMTAQVELRQHIWKRHGIVAWVGVGNVFHDSNSFGNLLPNFGVGYRFSLRPGMNLRLDYGWGKKGINGFAMAMYESF